MSGTHVIDLAPYYGFFFVFTRLAGFFAWMPGIGDNRISMKARLMFALLTSVLIFLSVQSYLPSTPLDSTAFNMAITAEFILGVFAAFTVRILIAALDMAGTLVGFNMGLANAFAQSVATAQQSGIIAVFITFVGLMTMFALNLDHQLIALMLQSFQIFPAGQLFDAGVFNGDFSHMLVNFLQASFLMALQIAAPVTILGLLMMIGAGIVNRLMPALQVFFILQPLQILLGFAIILLSLGVMMDFFIGDMAEKLKSLWNQA